MVRTTALGMLVLVFAIATAQHLSATIITYSGIDGGIGPGGLRPNSNAAAASFDSAASLLNPINFINFESAPLGNFASLGIASGVTATLTGTASDADAGITNILGDTTLGYNTTLGGNQFLRFVPTFNIGTASFQLTFTNPVQAFGTYITGLGTASGTLQVNFFDGASQSLPVSGTSNGGVRFFGFTDAGTSITSVSLQLNGVTSTRDISGFDDLRYVDANGLNAVPEPSSFTLFGIVTLGIAIAAIRRQRLLSSNRRTFAR